MESTLKFKFVDTKEKTTVIRVPNYPNGTYLVDGYQFDDFYHFSSNHPIDDDRINRWIREGLSHFENNTISNYYLTQSGDSMVVILKDDEDYTIVVSKNPSVCTINR